MTLWYLASRVTNPPKVIQPPGEMLFRTVTMCWNMWYPTCGSAVGLFRVKSMQNMKKISVEVIVPTVSPRGKRNFFCLPLDKISIFLLPLVSKVCRPCPYFSTFTVHMHYVNAGVHNMSPSSTSELSKL